MRDTESVVTLSWYANDQRTGSEVYAELNCWQGGLCVPVHENHPTIWISYIPASRYVGQSSISFWNRKDRRWHRNLHCAAVDPVTAACSRARARSVNEVRDKGRIKGIRKIWIIPSVPLVTKQSSPFIATIPVTFPEWVGRIRIRECPWTA